jgi:hypothetical protein
MSGRSVVVLQLLMKFLTSLTDLKTEYRKPLTSCGCNHNVEPVAISLNFFKRKKRESAPAQPGEAFKNADPPDHPSIHNSVVILNEPRYDLAKQGRQQRATRESRESRISREGTSGKGKAAETVHAEEDVHSYAFARPVVGPPLGFRMLGAAGWALRAPFDPRVADGSRLGNGIHVYGADPSRVKDKSSQAVQKAAGWLV